MALVGIVAKKQDIKSIERQIKNESIKIIEVKNENIEHLKNVKFDEIIVLKNIKLDDKTYKYMKQIMSNVNYLIINSDIDIEFDKKQIDIPIKMITFGFNSKATITISSIKEDKIIVCIQRNIEKINKQIIEVQEKEVKIDSQKDKKIYNNLSVFIITQLHNL